MRGRRREASMSGVKGYFPDFPVRRVYHDRNICLDGGTKDESPIDAGAWGDDPERLCGEVQGLKPPGMLFRKDERVEIPRRRRLAYETSDSPQRKTSTCLLADYPRFSKSQVLLLSSLHNQLSTTACSSPLSSVYI